MKQVSFADAMKWKYPEWIILVVSVDEKQQVNVMPAGWAMICSGDPAMFAVAINRHNYTHEVIAKQREFVVAFPSREMEADILYCGTHSGRDGSKLEHTNLETTPATAIQTPLLKNCRLNLECKLVEQIATGDHSIFAGQVMVAHVDPAAAPNLVNFGNHTFAVAQPESS